MKGEPSCPTAIASPEEVKATPPRPLPPGNVAGLVYLTPKPDADQGYAVMKGELSCATAIASPDGLKATPRPVPPGNVAGLVY